MKIAINGFGRIGKNITRHLIEAGYLSNQGGELELVAINDLGKICLLYTSPSPRD